MQFGGIWDCFCTNKFVSLKPLYNCFTYQINSQHIQGGGGANAPSCPSLERNPGWEHLLWLCCSTEPTNKCSLAKKMVTTMTENLVMLKRWQVIPSWREVSFQSHSVLGGRRSALFFSSQTHTLGTLQENRMSRKQVYNLAHLSTWVGTPSSYSCLD